MFGRNHKSACKQEILEIPKEHVIQMCERLWELINVLEPYVEKEILKPCFSSMCGEELLKELEHLLSKFGVNLKYRLFDLEAFTRETIENFKRGLI